jgi:hypothetical protein
MRVVGDEVLIWRIEEGVGGSVNGDGGHSLFLLVRVLVIVVITIVGGILFMNHECPWLLVEGVLVVTGLGGELGVALGEGFGLVLANKPPAIDFSLLKGAVRYEVALVITIVASSCLLPFFWILGETS